MSAGRRGPAIHRNCITGMLEPEFEPRSDATPRPAARSFRFQIIVFIMRSNVVACRQPNAIVLCDVVQSLFQVFMTERLVDDEWMQTERHHPACLLSVLVELVELPPPDRRHRLTCSCRRTC